MNIEEIRDYCLAKPGVTESLPFNETALVFKVMGKMVTFLDLPFVWNLRLIQEFKNYLGSAEKVNLPGLL